MINQLFTFFTFVVALSISVPVLSQEGSKQEKAKETPAQEKAEKANSVKEARWEGIVIRSNKDENTLTVRKRGGSQEKVVHYSASKVVPADASNIWWG